MGSRDFLRLLPQESAGQEWGEGGGHPREEGAGSLGILLSCGLGCSEAQRLAEQAEKGKGPAGCGAQGGGVDCWRTSTLPKCPQSPTFRKMRACAHMYTVSWEPPTATFFLMWACSTQPYPFPRERTAALTWSSRALVLYTCAA